MSDYKLDVQNGRVKYIMVQKFGPVGSDTREDSALWMLAQNKPFRSTTLEGYPIGVRTENGDEYFFAGVWPQKRQKKRIKDAVCGNDCCEL